MLGALIALSLMTGAAIATNNLVEAQQALAQAHAARQAALARSAELDHEADIAHDAETAALTRSAAIAARVQAAEAEVEAGQSRIDVIETLRRRQRLRLADAQRPAFRLIAVLELLAKRPAVLSLIAPNSLRDFIHLRAVLSRVLPEIRARTAGLRAEVRAGAVLRAEADDALTLLNASRAQRVDQQQRLAADARAEQARTAALKK